MTILLFTLGVAGDFIDVFPVIARGGDLAYQTS